jgi:hypothetical protein
VNQPARSKRGRRRRHCTCSGHTQIKWMTHCRVASCRPADTYQQRRRIEPLHPRPPAAEVRLHNWLVRGRLTPPGLYTDPQGPVGDTLTGQSNTHNLRHTTRLSPPRKHAAWPSCSSALYVQARMLARHIGVQPVPRSLHRGQAWSHRGGCRLGGQPQGYRRTGSSSSLMRIILKRL